MGVNLILVLINSNTLHLVGKRNVTNLSNNAGDNVRLAKFNLNPFFDPLLNSLLGTPGTSQFVLIESVNKELSFQNQFGSLFAFLPLSHISPHTRQQRQPYPKTFPLLLNNFDQSEKQTIYFYFNFPKLISQLYHDSWKCCKIHCIFSYLEKKFVII